jgi:dTDP-4-amino-4,6-dideoxygalactose transaminase
MTQDFIPIARPDITDDDIAEVVDTLRSGWLTLGPKTHRLEEEFARLTGAAHAVAVNSCTAGMHLALLAAGIGPGDEVITTPLTFASTANVIVHTGATPVLADICADDLNIDPRQIERKLTPRTRAIMPVHYGGQACRMDEIMAIARPHGIRVIEDAAHCAGALYRGRPVGSIGDASAFSFYAIKNMTTGEGGMVTTDDAGIAEKVRVLRNQGMDTNAWNRYSAEGTPFYVVSELGFNYRMTDMQAALGLGQLARLADNNRERTRLAALYTRLFAGVPGVETPAVRPEVTSNWHLYVIRLSQPKISRNAIVERLRERGIGTAVHFYPVHYHPYYDGKFGLRRGDYPVAEAEFERLLSLPLFPTMSNSDVERVVTELTSILASG